MTQQQSTTSFTKALADIVIFADFIAINGAQVEEMGFIDDEEECIRFVTHDDEFVLNPRQHINVGSRGPGEGEAVDVDGNTVSLSFAVYRQLCLEDFNFDF